MRYAVRDEKGRILPSEKPEAQIKKFTDHYYVLTMGEREIGGTSQSALTRYARKNGYKVKIERGY